MEQGVYTKEFFKIRREKLTAALTQAENRASEVKKQIALWENGEAAARRCAEERYCRQLYRPDSNPLLADAIADLAFAQSERLTLAEPENPQADDRERAMVYIVAVYTLFALSLHGRTDFAALFLEAWANFNMLASARVIRRRYDKSWHSRYNSLFYPLG